MTHALIRDGKIEQVGAPQTWFDGERWWDLREVIEPESGWLHVNEVPRPPDTETTTFDYTITLLNGEPTETWTQRPKTTVEVENDARQVSVTALMVEATTALASLKTTLIALDQLIDGQVDDPAVAIESLARELRTVTKQAIRLSQLQLGQIGPVDDA